MMKVRLGVRLGSAFRPWSGGAQAPTWSLRPTCLSRLRFKMLSAAPTKCTGAMRFAPNSSR